MVKKQVAIGFVYIHLIINGKKKDFLNFKHSYNICCLMLTAFSHWPNILDIHSIQRIEQKQKFNF